MTPALSIKDTGQDVALAIKRLAFPLRAPRYQTLAFWPLHVVCAAIDGYHQALLAVLEPQR